MAVELAHSVWTQRSGSATGDNDAPGAAKLPVPQTFESKTSNRFNSEQW